MSDHKTPVKDSLDEAEVSTTKNLDTRVWRRCVVRCISESSKARTIYREIITEMFVKNLKTICHDAQQKYLPHSCLIELVITRNILGRLFLDEEEDFQSVTHKTSCSVLSSLSSFSSFEAFLSCSRQTEETRTRVTAAEK